jgi:molybdenum cofactor biosynthesis protein B
MASASDSQSSPQEHRQAGPESVCCAVITVSDSRDLTTDTSGALISELLNASGHQVLLREIVPDGPECLGPMLDQLRSHPQVQAILLTGGTGLAPRDLTPEVVLQRLDAVLPGFGEIFRMLSWEQVGAAGMLSRAVAGRMGNKMIFLMPGSRNAVRLAMEKLILPELSHVVGHAGQCTMQ